MQDAHAGFGKQLEDEFENFVFRSEVGVEGADGRARESGDHGNGSGMVATLCEQPKGSDREGVAAAAFASEHVLSVTVGHRRTPVRFLKFVELNERPFNSSGEKLVQVARSARRLGSGTHAHAEK